MTEDAGYTHNGLCQTRSFSILTGPTHNVALVCFSAFDTRDKQRLHMWMSCYSSPFF